MLKKSMLAAIDKLGYTITRKPPSAVAFSIPDADLYRPLFSPWLGTGPFKNLYEIAAPNTLVSADRCYVLYCLLLQALHLPGDVWECGVYKGGTASMLAEILTKHNSDKRLFLFDTFEGMPATDSSLDWHKKGDFHDTTMQSVMDRIPSVDRCIFKKGYIPQTFAGLEDCSISFAHIDVDIFQSIMDCLAFIWPRLTKGGFMVFDDYGFPTCPGARTAVDQFFRGKPSVPLCIPTGQCVVFKSI